MPGSVNRVACPRGVARALCFSLLAYCPGAAGAAGTAGTLDAAPASEASRCVVIDDQLSEPLRTRVEESLRELLARIGLVLTGADSGADDRAIVRVTVEPFADVVLVDVSSLRGSDPPLRYRVERTTDELLAETLAHVILGGIEPRLAEAPEPEPAIAPSPATPAPDAAPAPPAPAEVRSTWSLGAQGRSILLAAEGVQGAVGATLALTLETAWRPSATLDAAYWLPRDVDQEGVRAESRRFGGRLGVRVEPLGGERWALHLGLGGGVDFISLTPGALLPPASSTGTSAHAQPMLGCHIGARWALTDGIDLMASVGVDVELMPRRWWIESASDRSALFETPRWLPYGTLGFEWRLSASSAALPSGGP